MSRETPRNATANIIAESGLPLVYKVASPDRVDAPAGRLPDYLRTQVTSLTVFQKEAIVTSSRSGEAWRMASDEGKYLMGHDAAPAPLTFLTVGMVASMMNEILALAELRGIAISDIELIQDNFYSMRGSMRDGSMRAGAEHVHLEARIDGDVGPSEMLALVADAVAASPLTGLMRGRNEGKFTLHHNGERIATAEASELEVALPPSEKPPGQFPQMAEGDWSNIVVRGPPTPKSALSDSYAGSSLEQEQNRLLHLRGKCRLREDGVKEIEQQLFNPHGSIFHFLSDESDGGGRAPSAAAYVSAGIGFCFMTQFGRFAKMQNSRLAGYRIVQESFFSLGGASGGTGQAGEADPLETHVYLETDEDENFSRYILDTAERTCFLHAFCRTDLKIKIKVRTFTEPGDSDRVADNE